MMSHEDLCQCSKKGSKLSPFFKCSGSNPAIGPIHLTFFLLRFSNGIMNEISGLVKSLSLWLELLSFSPYLSLPVPGKCRLF